MKLRILFSACILLFSSSVFSVENNPIVIKKYANSIDIGEHNYRDLSAILEVIKEDEKNLSDEDKINSISKALKLSPFEIKRNKSEVVKKYETRLKDAKDYFSSGEIIALLELGGLNVSKFEEGYDFEKQQYSFPNLRKTFCLSNTSIDTKMSIFSQVNLRKPSDCLENWSASLPEKNAEQIYNLLRERKGVKLLVFLVMAHQNEIEVCEDNFTKYCLSGELKSMNLAFIDDSSGKMIFDAPINFK